MYHVCIPKEKNCAPGPLLAHTLTAQTARCPRETHLLLLAPTAQSHALRRYSTATTGRGTPLGGPHAMALAPAPSRLHAPTGHAHGPCPFVASLISSMQRCCLLPVRPRRPVCRRVVEPGPRGESPRQNTKSHHLFVSLGRRRPAGPSETLSATSTPSSAGRRSFF